MMKRVIVLSGIFVSLFIFPQQIFAVTTTINDFPASISDSPFSVTVTVTGATPGTNFLRVDIFKAGTTNYFGETFNGTNWYSGSDGTEYYPITVGSDKTWTGSVQAQIGKTIPESYDKNGTYDLRVRRYTAASSYNNDEAKAGAVEVTLVYPTFTPIPTSTLVPTHTPTPTSTPKPTKAPTPSFTPKPTSSASSRPSTEINHQTIVSQTGTVSDMAKNNPVDSDMSDPTVATTSAEAASSESILGDAFAPTPTVVHTPVVAEKKEHTAGSFVPFVFTVAGGICLVVCGILVYRKLGIRD